MKTPRVGIGIACKDDPLPQTVDAIKAMDYPYIAVVVMNLERDHHSFQNQLCDNVNNVTLARNALRDHVLRNTDWDYLLMIDDDVVPPPNTIQELLWMKSEMVCAWVPSQPDGKRWMGGKISPDRKWFQPFTRARVVKGRMDEPGVAAGIDGPYYMDRDTGSLVWNPITSDIATTACTLISRALLELIPFRWSPTTMATCTVRRHPVMLADSGALGQDVQALGEKVVMSHRIVCQHLKAEKQRK